MTPVRILLCAIAAFAIAITAAASASAAGENVWSVDPVESNAEFAVTHFGIARVKGFIPIKSASIVMPANATVPQSVEATLDATGIDTKNADRDKDLRSAHFLEVDKYPMIAFRSTKITPGVGQDFTVDGDLTIHGVTRPVTLAARFEGRAVTPDGARRIAYTASTAIDRRDFGMTYFIPIVGNEVRIEIVVNAAAR